MINSAVDKTEMADMKIRVWLLLMVCITLLLSVESKKKKLKQSVRKLQLEMDILKIDSDTFKREIYELREYLNNSMCLCNDRVDNGYLEYAVPSEDNNAAHDDDNIRQQMNRIQSRFDLMSSGIVDTKQAVQGKLEYFSHQIMLLERRYTSVLNQTAQLSENARKDDVKRDIEDKKLEEIVSRLVNESLFHYLEEIAKGQTDMSGKRGIIDEKKDPVPALQFRDCRDILDSRFGSGSGPYTITLPVSGDHVTVYCDMETDGGGWTIFQRRVDGSVNFYRNFTDYERGFGNVANGEFWLGLRTVHELTHGTDSELRLDLEDAVGDKADQTYESFYLTEGPDYALNIKRGTGSAGDVRGMSYNNGRRFSTYDRDVTRRKCPRKNQGAWWYYSCTYVNLNGVYVTPGTVSGHNYGEGGVTYRDFRDLKSLKATQMMFKRVY